MTARELIEPVLEPAEREPPQGRPSWRKGAAADAWGGRWHDREDDRIVRPKLSAYQETLEIRTPGRGFTDVSRKVAEVVARSGLGTALCTVFVKHTSASLVIQENADPNVLRDLGSWLAELAPESRAWVHDDEGPDDMPAHARSAVTKTSEAIPVTAGKLALGTWQALYLWEHRARPHTRLLVVHVAGD